MTSDDGRRAATRALAVTRGVTNLLLVADPGRVVATLAPGPIGPPHWLVRLLGVRVVLQQAVVLLAPTRRLVLLGAAVDGLHAASMVAAAFRWPPQRRAASVSAAAAATSAVLGLATAPGAPRS